jgi:hypothetical protein
MLADVRAQVVAEAGVVGHRVEAGIAGHDKGVGKVDVGKGGAEIPPVSDLDLDAEIELQAEVLVGRVMREGLLVEDEIAAFGQESRA